MDTVREGPRPAADIQGILQSLSECRDTSSDVDDTLPARLLAALAVSDEPHGALVRSVCELATDPDPLVTRRGIALLFAGIAEPLGDSFAPESVAAHDRLFSHAVEFCRHRQGGAHLDAQLDRFGLRDRVALLHRRSTISPTRPMPADARARVRKVFVLSRVTLGADVAIASIVLQVIQRVFPDADRYLVGSPATGQLLRGLSGARMFDQAYARGGLHERLDSWHDLTLKLEQATAGLADSEWLVIDPDSRFTQLGLLPVARPTVPYMFFESRSYRVPGLETLGELVAHWMTEAFGCTDFEPVRPRVALSPTDLNDAHRIVHAFRRRTSPFVVAANLGVGGNARKRVPEDFELNLIRALLREGSGVILDYGAGEDETRVHAIVGALRRDGRAVVEVTGTDFSATAVPVAADLLTYRGPVGPFAALTGASDLYVGYDSGFQHVAAAQGIPTVDIFVDPPNVIFPRRWRPHTATAVSIDTTSGGHDSSLVRITEIHRRLREAAVAR